MKNIILFVVALLSLVLITSTVQSQVTVSGSTGADGDYTTLTSATGAFNAINSNDQTGNNILITITADATAEDGAISLNAGAWTTITINPTGGAARTISGTVATGPMINLNGADNVTIDGLNTGGNSLTITNLSTSNTSTVSTIRFIGGATSNTITNCTVLGSFTGSVATNGGTIFFSTDALTANGNDNNTISNCNIGPNGSDLPTKGIHGNGSTTTTAIGNSGIVINNNNIYDYFRPTLASSGVVTSGGCNNWTVTNNRFYQTGTRTWTSGPFYNKAIELTPSTATSGMQGAVVTGNIIGYSSNTQTGTYTLTGVTGKFMGIHVNAITGGTLNDISNNTIASVSLTGVASSGTGTSSPFIGILAQTGVINTNNNTIGSQSATGSLTYSTTTTTTTDVYGIYNFSSSIGNANNNNIGGISVTNAGASGTFIVYGIRINTGTTVAFTATSNNIGGTVANSIQLTATGASSQVIGLITNNAPSTFTSNNIRNLTNNIGTGTTTAASVIGISATSTTPTHTISQNTIHSLHNSNISAATTVCGIQFTASSGSNVVERNFIHSLNNASTAGIINGMNVSGGTTTYKNNMIRLGVDKDGNSITNSVLISGISEPLGTDNFYNNSVYIGGTSVVSGTINSFAFNSSQITNTRNFRNNIFWNARSNTSGTGKHYAVRVGGATPNPTGLTIDYNVYYVSGTGGTFGLFNAFDVADLAAWKTAVGQDGASISGFDPQFIAPNGTSSTVDLHIHASNPTVIEGSGISIAGVTDDYDGQTRSGLTPTDIGADAGDFVAQDVSAPAISYTVLTNTSNLGNRILSSTITDVSGVPTAGILQPRIYYRKNADPYFSSQGSLQSGSGTNGVWDFTIVAADMGGITVDDVISYFVIAQDISGPSITSNPSVGLVATDVNTVTTAPTTPNTYTIVNIPMSGDFTVGVSMFRAVTGLNIQFETRTRKVLKEVPIESDKSSSYGKNNGISESKQHLFGEKYEEGKSTMVEVDELYSVPMLNGNEYKGELYHELTRAEKQNLNLNDNILGIYATITAAVADVGIRGVGATDCRLLLTDALYNTGSGETFPIIIDATTQLPTSTSNFIIKPNTGVTATIGDVSTTGIFVSRAPYVVFDGTAIGNSGSRDLTITNTSTATGTYVIGLFNNTAPKKADNNTIKYCNIIGGMTTVSTNAIFGIILNSLGGDFDNCLIDNNVITSVKTGVQIAGVSGFTSDNVTVSNNTIGSMTEASSCFFQGITVSQADNTIISGNEIIGHAAGDIINGATGTPTNNMCGIAMATGTTNAKIRKNKIHDFNFAGTTQGYGAFGIVYNNAGNATGTTEISNNLIYLIKGDGDVEGTSAASMGFLPQGICVYANGTSAIQIYYNSVYMSGATLGASFNGSSACLGIANTVGAGSLDIRNNIFQNSMTPIGGPNPTNNETMCIWVAGLASNNNIFSNINYNDYYCDGNLPQIGYFSSFRLDLPAWQTASGQDASSLSANPGFMSTTDLSIDAASPNVWNVSGMGQPIAIVSTDINGAARSTTVAGGSTDIGAYNVTPSSTPASAIQTGTLANSSTTTYTLPNGRVLGSIAWGAGGTVPTSVDVVFYPGVNPPGSSGFAVANGYWVITPTGGSGYTYDITLNYDDAQIGNVTPESNLRVLKSDDGGTSYTPFLSFVPNTTLNTITVTGLSSFSIFGLGDNDAPLPVNLTSFTSNINGRNVKLNWVTDSEQNNAGFDVERKALTGVWVKAGFVQGKGTTTTTTSYSFEDKNLNAGKYNYRLKQIDVNGNFEYHNLNSVLEVGLPTKFDISQNYPNPFNPTTKVDFQLPVDSKVSILVYDMTGREIKTLLKNELRTAGYYTAEFNGSSFASGTYFYRFITEAGGKQNIITKKMVLIK
ncbi:MAG: T9SS type A sorting domain-containing protein [Candidatus Kapaibacterium sp.]